MGTSADSIAALRTLSDMGVRMAIDDFGTGYSNLAYLRDLPVHTLKLAGTFLTRRGLNNHGTPRGDRTGPAAVGAQP